MNQHTADPICDEGCPSKPGSSNETRITGVELHCDDCQQPYGCWFADNDVWNYVIGGPAAKDDPGGMLCPRCFTIRAEVVFEQSAIWHLTLDRSGKSGDYLRANAAERDLRNA